MAAYHLEATHSVIKDRSRDRHGGVLEISCTLTVYLLTLQPIVDAFLSSPISRRRPRAISIHNVRRYNDGFGAKTWMFTVRLRTCKKKVRVRTWWGKRLPTEELNALPLALLSRLERSLCSAWCRHTGNRNVLSTPPCGVMKLSV